MGRGGGGGVAPIIKKRQVVSHYRKWKTMTHKRASVTGNWTNKNASPHVPSQNHMQEVSEVLLPVSCQQLGVWQPTSLQESHSWPIRFKFSLQLLKCRCVSQNINRPIRWELLCDRHRKLMGNEWWWRRSYFMVSGGKKWRRGFNLRIFT